MYINEDLNKYINIINDFKDNQTNAGLLSYIPNQNSPLILNYDIDSFTQGKIHASVIITALYFENFNFDNYVEIRIRAQI